MMIIVGKRWGYLVPVITFASMWLTELLLESLTDDPQFYQDNRWTKLAAVFLAALIILLTSRWIDARGSRELIDKNTGEEILLQPDDSFFFIPMRIWPYILAVAGLWLYWE